MEISRLTLETANPAEQLEFYRDLLQFEPAGRGVKLGHSMLDFVPQEGIVCPVHFAINVSFDEIERVPNWLIRRGVEPVLSKSGLPIAFPSWAAKSVYFYDPAGNIGEFIGREALGTLNEMSISEVGVPVQGVIQIANEWKKLLKVHTYGDALEGFEAIGDEKGLLILVDQGREWFPQTGVMAQLSSFKLKVKARFRNFRLTSNGEKLDMERLENSG